MQPFSTIRRTGRMSCAALFLFTLVIPLDTAARQSTGGEGEVVRAGWPDVIYETQGAMHLPQVRAAEQYAESALLPRVDTLALRYAWSVIDDLPYVEFDLRWVRGKGGVLDGEIVEEEQMPYTVILDAVDLHADVIVSGRRVGDLVLSLDDLVLEPAPAEYGFETFEVGWDDVFADMDSATARLAFGRGFTLEKLDVLRAVFEQAVEPEPPGRDVVIATRQPRRRTIFVPDTDIWIGWNLGPDIRRTRPRDGSRTRAPRGDTAGRTAADDEPRPARGGRRAESDDADNGDAPRIRMPDLGDDDDDDDDDDRDLLGPAVMGLAAVGALAFAGGTLGIQGNGDAPFGLFAGAVRPRWAFLFHAAVNNDVISKGDHEKLRAGMAWYARPVAGGVRPGIGFGTLIREVGDAKEFDAAVDAGLLFSRGQLVIMASMDVLSGTPRFGFGVNLRAPRTSR